MAIITFNPAAPLPRLSRIALAAGLPALAIAATLAQAAPKAATVAPIKNFRLPVFTEEGFRQTMIRAAEARLPSPGRIEGTEVEVTLFNGKAGEQIDAMLAAPSATLFPEQQLATGAESVRLERIDLTVTGSDWSYQHGEQTQKIIIRRDAHVVIRLPLGDLL